MDPTKKIEEKMKGAKIQSITWGYEDDFLTDIWIMIGDGTTLRISIETMGAEAWLNASFSKAEIIFVDGCGAARDAL